MSYNASLASRNDFLWNASALISQRLFQGKPLSDRLWVVSTALTIIGFVAYELLIATWLDTSKLAKGSAKVAIDDIIKFSTMFVVARILSGGAASSEGASVMSTEEWVKDSGLFISGLVTYDLLFSDLVAQKTSHLDKKVVTAVNDVLKFGTVFVTNNFAKGGEFNKEWAMSVAGYLTGVAVYDMIISRYTDKYVAEGTI